MQVTKRSGKIVAVDVAKITERIRKICREVPEAEAINVPELVTLICAGMYAGMPTSELDLATAQIAQPLQRVHPAYGVLAARVLVSNYRKGAIYALWTHFLHDNPALTLAEVSARYYEFVQSAMIANVNEIGDAAPLLDSTCYVRIAESEFDYSRNTYDYAGFALLEASYLARCSLRNAAGALIRVPIEDPQHMHMRICLGIHTDACAQHGIVEDWSRTVLGADALRLVRESYNMLSRFLFTHATPTMFNAGTRRPQMSSCFLTQIPEDSLSGIAKWWDDCAQISKYAGGVASAVHNIGAKGRYIAGTNGHSGGLVPWLRVSAAISEAVDQGGDKRPGTHAIYLEPWHADFMAFLELRKPRSEVNERAQNLFYAAWLPDEFMNRVRSNELYYFMCPHECPGLHTSHGEAHSALYRSYIDAGRYKSKMPAQDIWRRILALLSETGLPYILFKDNINRKSNHEHLGTIQSSNLCCEITEYSAPDETAVCNLASIGLAQFLRSSAGTAPPLAPLVLPNAADDSAQHVATLLAQYDFVLLERCVRVAVTNLDAIIDRNYYPTPATRTSNMRNRPIGLGIQGLADLYTLLGLPFDSPAAQAVQFTICERLYYYAVRTSVELAQRLGAYPTFPGSPASRGLLQPQMWAAEGHMPAYPLQMDWHHLCDLVMRHGMRNSLLTANMPTASTSTIMGMSPCFEPHNALVYKRGNRTGEMLMYNTMFVRDMIRRGLWDDRLRSALVRSRVCGIGECTWIPEDIRALYRVAFEISADSVVDSALCRGPFVDQSQSMNLFVPEFVANNMNKLYFRAWRSGAKTGSYYTRLLSATDAQKTSAVEAVTIIPVPAEPVAAAATEPTSSASTPREVDVPALTLGDPDLENIGEVGASCPIDCRNCGS